jgi:hypothetical protein
MIDSKAMIALQRLVERGEEKGKNSIQNWF